MVYVFIFIFKNEEFGSQCFVENKDFLLKIREECFL